MNSEKRHASVTGLSSSVDLTTGYNKPVAVESFNWEMTEVLNYINMGFFSRDMITDKYINLSAGCAKIYGYSIHDFFDNPELWFEVIYPADKKVIESESALLKKGRKSTSEYRIIHKDGSLRWIEVKVIPIFKDQELVRADGIVSDITDRKKSELQILKAKELTEIIMNSLPGIFYMYNSEGKFQYWNNSLETVTGYSAEEVAGLNPIELVDDADKKLLAERIATAFQTGRTDVETFLITKDGRKIPYYFNGRKVTIGGEVCLVGMGIDITKRREAEETLQKSEEMLSHILNSIPQSIFWKDLNSVFMGCNSVFAKVAGYKDTVSIIGKTDFDLPWLPEGSKKYQEDDSQVLNSELPRIHYIETLKYDDGNTLWVDTTKIPLKNENNEVYGLLGIMDDITERRLAEEKQEKINADLIQKNIELRQFSYIISHNLRSPISKILGLASLFEKEKEGNLINQELIEYIESEVLNLDNVVRDLSKIVGAQELGTQAIEQIYFQEELKLIMQALDMEIFESNARIIVDFKNASAIKSVRAYFYSIMYNLFSNAIKYRDPTRPLIIQIESGQEEQFICLSFQDNGLGIDLQKFGDKIFGLYNRFHTGVVPGKGIGLNLIKTQVETLGGRIELKSKPGEGCLFKVYFPREKE